MHIKVYAINSFVVILQKMNEKQEIPHCCNSFKKPIEKSNRQNGFITPKEAKIYWLFIWLIYILVLTPSKVSKLYSFVCRNFILTVKFIKKCGFVLKYGNLQDYHMVGDYWKVVIYFVFASMACVVDLDLSRFNSTCSISYL